MGQGTVRCAHGDIPLPAPAVAELLNGAKVCPSDIHGETVTPTGIALLKAFDCEYSDFPAMRISHTGIGCGTRDSDVPNILRVFIGSVEDEKESTLYRVECTIDDMTGEEFGDLWEHIYDCGARDMFYAPIYMKKGRPALKITVLSDKDCLEDVKKAIFTHTTTLGMVCVPVEREILNRRFETVETPYGEVTYKIAEGFGIRKAKAEYEDLHRIAKKLDISLKEARMQADIIYNKIHTTEE
ncbi:MAG: LarC family nickel insertion protein [Firmicutes bacterium]|nr:LarC family nickel insertion protein [Bacillota bacterium]